MDYYYPFIEGSYSDEVFICISFFDVPLNTYFISNYGRVYSIKSRRFLTLQTSTYGYYYIALGSNSRHFVHRLVAMAFVSGYSETRNCVNHKDGNKKNNYYMNLEWCSKAENNKHAYATHLNNYIGESCKNAKLSNDQVHYICKLLEDGYKINSILDIIGLERSMNNYELIRSIRKGYTWKSISKYYNIEFTDYPFDSISDNDVIKICECFEKGMSISETYEFVFQKPYISIKTCDKYNTLRNIRTHKSFNRISKNYNF